MPIYEFECQKCKAVIEKLILKESDESDIICENCNSRDFEKVMSKNNFKFENGFFHYRPSNPFSSDSIIKNGPESSIKSLQKAIK